MLNELFLHNTISSRLKNRNIYIINSRKAFFGSSSQVRSDQAFSRKKDWVRPNQVRSILASFPEKRSSKALFSPPLEKKGQVRSCFVFPSFRKNGQVRSILSSSPKKRSGQALFSPPSEKKNVSLLFLSSRKKVKLGQVRSELVYPSFFSSSSPIKGQSISSQVVCFFPIRLKNG